jgi:hypothetical protein
VAAQIAGRASGDSVSSPTKRPLVAGLHRGEVADTALLGGLVTGHERTFHQDPLFTFRLLADIAMRALSAAVSNPATAVQVLDTIESLLQALVSRDLDVADDAGSVRVVLAAIKSGPWPSQQVSCDRVLPELLCHLPAAIRPALLVFTPRHWCRSHAFAAARHNPGPRRVGLSRRRTFRTGRGTR